MSLISMQRSTQAEAPRLFRLTRSLPATRALQRATLMSYLSFVNFEAAPKAALTTHLSTAACSSQLLSLSYRRLLLPTADLRNTFLPATS